MKETFIQHTSRSSSMHVTLQFFTQQEVKINFNTQMDHEISIGRSSRSTSSIRHTPSIRIATPLTSVSAIITSHHLFIPEPDDPGRYGLAGTMLAAPNLRAIPLRAPRHVESPPVGQHVHTCKNKSLISFVAIMRAKVSDTFMSSMAFGCNN